MSLDFCTLKVSRLDNISKDENENDRMKSVGGDRFLAFKMQNTPARFLGKVTPTEGTVYSGLILQETQKAMEWIP